MRNMLLAAAAVVLMALPSEAGWKPLDGERVLDVTAKEWLNAGKDAPSVASLRGQVYLLEFFATW